MNIIQTVNTNKPKIKEAFMVLLSVFSLIYISYFFLSPMQISANDNIWNLAPVDDENVPGDVNLLEADSSEIDAGVFGGPLSSFSGWLSSIQTTVSRLIVDGFADMLTPDLSLIGKISNGSWGIGGDADTNTYDDITGDGMSITKTFWAAGVFLGSILATLLTLYNAVMLVAGRAQAIRESPISVICKYAVIMTFMFGSAAIINFTISSIADIWSDTIAGIEGAGGLSIEHDSTLLGVSVAKMIGHVITGNWLLTLVAVIAQTILFFKLVGGFFNMLKNYFEKYLILIILLCMSPFFVATLVSNTMRQSFSNYIRMLLGQFLSMLINFLVLMIYFQLWFKGVFSVSIMGFIIGCTFIKLSKNIDRYISMTGLNVAQAMQNTGRGFLANAANLIRSVEGLSRAGGRGAQFLSNRAMANGDLDSAVKYAKFSGGKDGSLLGAAGEKAGYANSDDYTKAKTGSVIANFNNERDVAQRSAKGQTFSFDTALNPMQKDGSMGGGVHVSQVQGAYNACPGAENYKVHRDEKGRTFVMPLGRNGSVLGSMDERGIWTPSSGDGLSLDEKQAFAKDSMAMNLANNDTRADVDYSTKLDDAYQKLDGVEFAETLSDDGHSAIAAVKFENTSYTDANGQECIYDKPVLVGTMEFEKGAAPEVYTVNKPEDQVQVERHFDEIQSRAYNTDEVKEVTARTTADGNSFSSSATFREASNAGMSWGTIQNMMKDQDKNGVYRTYTTTARDDSENLILQQGKKSTNTQ